MATVTGLIAEELEIEAASVGDNLILTKHDNSTIDAGVVKGPTGDIGFCDLSWRGPRL